MKDGPTFQPTSRSALPTTAAPDNSGGSPWPLPLSMSRPFESSGGPLLGEVDDQYIA